MKTKAIAVQSTVEKQPDPTIMIAEIGLRKSGHPAIPTQCIRNVSCIRRRSRVCRGRQEARGKHSEKVEIAPGTAHTFVHTTDNWLKMRNTDQPALAREDIRCELHELMHSGKVRGFVDSSQSGIFAGSR